MIQYFIWTEQFFISVAAISYLKFAISMKVYYEMKSADIKAQCLTSTYNFKKLVIIKKNYPDNQKLIPPSHRLLHSHRVAILAPPDIFPLFAIFIRATGSGFGWFGPWKLYRNCIFFQIEKTNFIMQTRTN